MDRLTIKHENGYLFKKPTDGYIDAVANKLGQLEDLEEQGLLQEAVEKAAQYIELENRLAAIFNGELSLKDYLDVLEQYITDKSKQNPLIARILTYEDAEEWDEYKRLRDSGLFLKIPTRKVFESSGDTVYYIFDYEIVECINCGLSVDYEGVIWIALACDEDIFPYRTPNAEIDLDPTDWCINSTTVNIDEWGKLVFLTREEAEQALEKMEEGVNNG